MDRWESRYYLGSPEHLKYITDHRMVLAKRDDRVRREDVPQQLEEQKQMEKTGVQHAVSALAVSTSEVQLRLFETPELQELPVAPATDATSEFAPVFDHPELDFEGVN